MNVENLKIRHLAVFLFPHSAFQLPNSKVPETFLNPAPLHTSPRIIGRKNRLPVLAL